jgi:hypothetical protein
MPSGSKISQVTRSKNEARVFYNSISRFYDFFRVVLKENIYRRV